MDKHRIWVAATLGWLFLLFNLERMYEPLNIASFVYVQATIIGIVLLLSQRSRSLSFAALSLVILAAFFGLKVAFRSEIAGDNLPVTVTEIGILLLTAWLMQRIGRDTDAFAEGTLQLLTMHLPTRDLASLQIQQDMEREVRRARRHDRPLTLMTLRPREESLQVNLQEFMQKIETELSSRFAQGRLAQLLMQETKSADLLGYRDETLVLMLPETDRVQATKLALRLKQRCEAALGFAIDMGLAEFPHEEITLFGLLDRANGETLPLTETTPSSAEPPGSLQKATG